MLGPCLIRVQSIALYNVTSKQVKSSIKFNILTECIDLPGILRRNWQNVLGVIASACSMSFVIVSRILPDGSPPTFNKNGLPKNKHILPLQISI